MKKEQSGLIDKSSKAQSRSKSSKDNKQSKEVKPGTIPKDKNLKKLSTSAKLPTKAEKTIESHLSPLSLDSIFSQNINKYVSVYLRKDKLYKGILCGIDEHNNILLGKCVEVVDGSSIEIGSCILNGGCIAYIEI
ncbi:hypothetical protein CDIK_1273 [Cucumispora dikerogammari]|nr:hypothetical protein CDIK_1273 [Cucumispora dikerogammari]